MNAKWILCAGLAALAIFLGGPLAKEGRANFILWDDEEITVDTYHGYGTLYDESCTKIVSGGYVGTLTAYDTSNVNMSGGSMGGLSANGSSKVAIFSGKMDGIGAYDTSNVNISGGSMDYLSAYKNSKVDISGGNVKNLLYAHDSSNVDISGGNVGSLYAHDSSNVDISGGNVGYLKAQDSSNLNISGGTMGSVRAEDLRQIGGDRVNISGGTVNKFIVSLSLEGDEQVAITQAPTASLLAQFGVNISSGTVSNTSWHYIRAKKSSTVDICGGSVDSLTAYDTSNVNISGGNVYWLHAYNTSNVKFIARVFRLGDGLSLDGDRVLGIGDLSGEWYDGTRWTVRIRANDSGATILAIPEPATLSLLALGGLALILRKRKR